jgi:hypothetical protein
VTVAYRSHTGGSIVSQELSETLASFQRGAFEYFWLGSHPKSGLPRDRLRADGRPIHEITSISGIGFGFLAIVVGVHRGWITPAEGLDRANKVLSSLGKICRYHGAFPHFVNSETCELIPFAKFDDGGDLVETALLLQGMVCAREYFSGSTFAERTLQTAVTEITHTVDWNWYTRDENGPLWWHWSPRHHWARNLPITGWNEALICYVLAAGSSRHPIDAARYHSGWARGGAISNGHEYLGTRLPLGEPFGGPMFLSQYSFCTLNPIGLSDAYCEDYSEQVRAHALINYLYCRGHYEDAQGWGLSACDGPRGYLVNSPTNDNGVIAPTAALSSLPFLPIEASAAADRFRDWQGGRLLGRFGLMDSFRPSTKWLSKTHLAINQGPIVAMAENYRSGLLWKLMMGAPEVTRGLKRLGFKPAISAF